MQEQTKTREWIIARIVKTEEAIASGGEVGIASSAHCPTLIASSLPRSIPSVLQMGCGTLCIMSKSTTLRP